MSTRLLRPAFRDRVLDAAADVIARHGIRKTTMDDVAREASCSRAGLYKHFSSKDALLQALLVREVGLFVDALRARAEHARGPRLLEDAFVFAVRYVREHPGAKAIIELEPESFLAAFAYAGRRMSSAAIDATAALVKILMDRGEIRRTNPRVVAELLLRLLVSFAIVDRLFDHADEEHSMRTMFREVVMKGLAS